MKTNLAIVDRAGVKKLPKGVAMHRSTIIRGRIVWAWKSLSALQRADVQHATRGVYFDPNHLARVLDARMAGTHATRKVKP